MVVATAFKKQFDEPCLKPQLPATQTFPSNVREELDCAANRSLVVSSFLDLMISWNCIRLTKPMIWLKALLSSSFPFPFCNSSNH